MIHKLAYDKFNGIRCKLFFNINTLSFKCLHSNAVNCSPVNLSYTKFEPENPVISSSLPIIILHGLLGSKQNWRSLGKAIANKSNKLVYTLDARNHGDSPHSEEFDYSSMTEDVKFFMKSNEISSTILIGHSMGGRTAMNMSLKEPNLINKLVIVDVSPKAFPNSSDIPTYMITMKEAIGVVSHEAGLTQARQDIDQYMSKSIQDKGLRHFLLTNLTEVDGIIKWKPNLKVLHSQFNSGIVEFSPVIGQFKKKTLFICGGNSPYVRTEDYPFIKTLFPNAEFTVIPGAGHWVHGEKPTEFIKAVCNFLEF